MVFFVCHLMNSGVIVNHAVYHCSLISDGVLCVSPNEQLCNCQSCSVLFLSGSKWHIVPGALGLNPKNPSWLLSVFSVSDDFSRQPLFSSVNVESSGANVTVADQTAVLVNLRSPEGTNFWWSTFIVLSKVTLLITYLNFCI